MKIRNHKKRHYIFYPHEESKIKGSKVFFYKSNLMKFLNKNAIESLNGVVSIQESGFGYFTTIREYYVWYNDRPNQNKQPFKIELRNYFY